MPEREKQYLFTAAQLRWAVGLGTVGIFVAVIAIFLLGTAHPRGKLVPLDDTQFRAHLEASTGDLSGYEVDGERARIDIERAIELVAERGVAAPGFYVAAAEAPAAEEEPADEGAAAAEETEAPVSGGGEAASLAEVDASAGEALYSQVCAACHMANGEGVPSAFPPLAGHVPELLSVSGGRDYVIDVVLFGLMGPISVDGVTYNSVMTPHQAQFDDQQVADVLDYVATAWGNADALPAGELAFTAAEVAEQRAEQLSSMDVHTLREELGLPD